MKTEERVDDHNFWETFTDFYCNHPFTILCLRERAVYSQLQIKHQSFKKVDCI